MSAMAPGQQTTLVEACQRVRDDDERGVSASAREEGPEAVELPCGCPATYEEAGECLIHDQRFNTVEQRRVEQQTATDGLEGRL